MGMAASQARLLSLTARMTDNENSGQDISYAKIRLSQQTEQANNDYLEALDATKLTVLTGFDGTTEVYTDISYALMTGYNTVACGLQYIVTDTDGKILVTEKQAKAYEAGNGDLNKFLAALGYSQADIDVNDAGAASDEDKALAKQKIHEAWDQYLTSVDLHYGDDEHGLDFGYNSFSTDAYDGYATYTLTDLNTGAQETKALNYEGTTREQRELYDYAVSLTEAYYGTSNSITGKKTSADPDNASYVQYLTNIFQKMASSGFYTDDEAMTSYLDNTGLKTTDPEYKSNKDKWFENELRAGNLLLEYYSTTERKFVSTSIDSDSAIQEVEDEREIARIEREYQNKLSDLESKDNRYDLELRKLDTEHSALQTEYDSVKNVIDKNVEKSFSIFS